MSIMPLPVFEADADSRHRSAMTDEEIYARLEPPKTIVVKFGAMKLVGEYPYGGDAKPGCGSKLVARTHRGTEVVEMLTTTCENAGCAKSVTRKELLDYVANSGGRDFPFYTNGRILRVATIEDLNKQAALQNDKRQYVQSCKQKIAELGLGMKLVDVEPILGGELLTYYYMAEQRVDFRELVRQLAGEFKTRIEMRQVGARDEARLVADYERCGQHCCCKNFLKVLKPVSMRAAKTQKATLDPLKISGRCGRLMCCLRYEDQTYRDLKKNLPKKGKRVGTAYGPGTVIDGKILVQLVLVRMDYDSKEIAVPVEELMDPESCPPPGTVPVQVDAEGEVYRGMSDEEVAERVADDDGKAGDERGDRPKSKRRRRKSRAGQQDAYREQTIKRERSTDAESDQGRTQDSGPDGEGDRKRGKRRRSRRRDGGRGESSGSDTSRQQASKGGGPVASGESDESSAAGAKKKKRRRRGGRRRKRGDGRPGGSDADAGD
jgi:cell fate regulator YaaT (PSP1 superfamily)